MADPTNYEQFNANVTELVKVVQDALKAAYGLENVSHGQALGLLAGIDDLANAPVGDASMLRDAINFGQATLAEIKKYGLGGDLENIDDAFGVNATKLFFAGSSTPNIPTDSSGYYLHFNRADGYRALFAIDSNNKVNVTVEVGGVWSEWTELRSDKNTTVDSNGFIKEASPIVRLTNDATCALGAGFTDAGAGTANTEAQGVTAEHVGTGVYEVSGSLGLATDGWQIELPQERGTGQHLIMAQTEWNAETEVLTVRTFNRQFDVNTASIVPGDPTDIPDGRWLDLRLEMPEPEIPEEETTP